MTEQMKAMLKNRVQFGIGSAYLIPPDRQQSDGIGRVWDAVTVPEISRQNKNCNFVTHRRIFIELALELLLPLFRNDIKPIEVLCCQFYVAATIMHEFAVSLNILINCQYKL